MIVAALLSLCLCATAAPETRLPWEKLSAASPVNQEADDILRFEPTTYIDVLWKTFKAEYGTRPVRT